LYQYADHEPALRSVSAESFSSQANMPTAQIYRINVDNRFPYRIYGGQQDNTSVVIASRELAGAGITTASWQRSAGGESAFLAFDPDNPRYVPRLPDGQSAGLQPHQPLRPARRLRLRADRIGLFALAWCRGQRVAAHGGRDGEWCGAHLVRARGADDRGAGGR
jgi:hypothetical protein